MTRRRLAPIGRTMPSHRETHHPLTQAMRLVREWLREGSATHHALERRAAERGLPSGRLAEAIRALNRRGEISVVTGPTATLQYRRNPGSRYEHDYDESETN